MRQCECCSHRDESCNSQSWQTQHLYICTLVPDVSAAWQKFILVRLHPDHPAAEVRNFKVGIMSGTQRTDVSMSNDFEGLVIDVLARLNIFEHGQSSPRTGRVFFSTNSQRGIPERHTSMESYNIIQHGHELILDRICLKSLSIPTFDEMPKAIIPGSSADQCQISTPNQSEPFHFSLLV